ncbi:unnamed protein product, partial [Mesorhabditis spiculigera]
MGRLLSIASFLLLLRTAICIPPPPNVEQQYEFAIPDLNVSCICECESSDKCNADLYEYKECPSFKNSPTVSCYRTFFTSQSSSGCSSGDTPNLCCEVELRPWQDRSFTAIKIKQPQTFGTFVYTAYDFQGVMYNV